MKPYSQFRRTSSSIAKVIAFSLVPFLGLSGCGSPATIKSESELKSASDSPIQDWNDTMATLKGYDLLTDFPKGDCVQSTDLEDAATNAGGNLSSFSVQYVTDAESLNKLLNVSASAKLSAAGGLGVSAKANYSNQISVNQYSVYAIVNVNVQKSAKIYRSVKMKDQVLSFLNSPNAMEAFRKRCGDRFIIGQRTGGELSAVIEIKASSKSEKEAISASVKGNSGTWSASGSFSSTIQKLASKYSLSLTAYKAGGSNLPIPKDAQELVDRALGFEAEVDARSVPITAILAEYETTDNFPFVFPVDISTSIDVIEQLNRMRLALNTNRANIIYVLQNRSQFKNIEESYLSNKLNDLNSAQNTILDLARACGRDYAKCLLPTNLVDVEVILPEWQTETEIFGEHPSCGVEENNSGAGEVCGIDTTTYNEGNGNVCGISRTIYVTKRDSYCGLENPITSASICGTESYDYTWGEAILAQLPETDRCYALGGNVVIHDWNRSVPVTCAGVPKTCGDPTKGPIYKECTNASFGVQETLYNSCRHESFGTQSVTYKTCANAAFGVKKYKSCLHI